MNKILIALTLAFAAHGALANSACDKPKNDFDDLYCLDKVYLQADKDLNDAYGKLVKQLDADGKAALKKGQLAWISSRNTECSWKDNRGFFVNLDCATRMTTERAQFLVERLRECTSAGCMNSKLQ
ncbi:lysozyme inhibitor LprI family protein [Andreprevotia chitinilytica]|uniref:lysozyme inhibitor LprI family protein n=1 Tax=Andreprevotia chitinilytica TaxID=396808 RepID=UPI000691BC51|nr:lysozyme inhibitor LprI family protein [Andreprevotia chitinilytica]